MDISTVEAKAKADIAAAEHDEALVKSWIVVNWDYAVALAVAGLVLGAAIGYRLGLHSHV